MCLPAGLCDDHLCTERVELVPQFLVLQAHANLRDVTSDRDVIRHVTRRRLVMGGAGQQVRRQVVR